MPVFSFTTLDDPLAIWTFVNGINNSGQIVGYYLVNGVASHGFIFIGGL